MLHKVKLLSGFYQAVIDGIKPFEIRYNDRNYRKGDDIIFNEWKDDAYTGRLCCAVIKDVFDIGFLMPGYVAFTFQILGRFETIEQSDVKNNHIKEETKEMAKTLGIAFQLTTSRNFKDIAEILINADYRKVSEIAKEIFEEVESCKWSETQYGDSKLCFEINASKYEKIKKKYTGAKECTTKEIN